MCLLVAPNDPVALCVADGSATPVFRIEWHVRLILRHNRLFNCSRLLTDCFTRLTGVFISPPPDSTGPGMNPWLNQTGMSVMSAPLTSAPSVAVVYIRVNTRSYCQWTPDTADFSIDNRWLTVAYRKVYCLLTSRVQSWVLSVIQPL